MTSLYMNEMVTEITMRTKILVFKLRTWDPYSTVRVTIL